MGQPAPITAGASPLTAGYCVYGRSALAVVTCVTCRSLCDTSYMYSGYLTGRVPDNFAGQFVFNTLHAQFPASMPQAVVHVEMSELTDGDSLSTPAYVDTVQPALASRAHVQPIAPRQDPVGCGVLN